MSTKAHKSNLQYPTRQIISPAAVARISLEMAESTPTTPDLPIIIIGAGISGLLLAQQLRKSNIPFEVFERDSDFLTRGVGWGLTLHWSLPALQELLPKELFAQLPNTYVDRAAVERGESSTFPYYDLSTGERKYSSPKAVESQRIRVTRERLRMLLATGIDIKVSCMV
jgi:2-polyprenyl-6-methoxyphenol hydroxylase-like FAD-dependent oxidoreductase